MLSMFLHDAWKVFLYSLVLGAGLPVLYAVGVRALAYAGAGAGAETAADAPGRGARKPVGMVLAGICFAVVIAGVAVGLLYVVAAGKGDQLSFEHVFPTIVPKS